MLSCKQVQELLFQEGLSLRRRAGLRLHLLLCKLCRRAERQLRSVEAAVRAFPDAAARHENGLLRPEARERIRKTLRES